MKLTKEAICLSTEHRVKLDKLKKLKKYQSKYATNKQGSRGEVIRQLIENVKLN